MKTVTFKCKQCGQELTFHVSSQDGHKCAICNNPILIYIGDNIRGQEDVKITHKLYERQKEIMHKPPIGIEPRWMHDGVRRENLIGAIYRYISDGREIPEEWIMEYNDITKKLKTPPALKMF